MITVLAMIWLISWRFRVAPRTADQHAQGTNHGHVVVASSRTRWHCRTCLRTESYNPPWRGREWTLTGVAVVSTLTAVWVGTKLGEAVGVLL